MNARTEGIIVASASFTRARTTRRPSALTTMTSSTGALPPLRSRSWASVRARTSFLSRPVSGSGVRFSAPVVSIDSMAASRASRHSSSTSMASCGSGVVRWRRSSKASSISWVRAAMSLNPIVALMPFMECAIRKISSTVSRSPGFSSIRTTARFSSCRCSRHSARNMGRYSEVSISSSGR